MKIYTRKGDKGETGLFGTGKRFSKSNLIFSVIGTVDEANSHLGLAASLVDPSLSHQKILKNKIEQVQRELFNLGAILAGVKTSISKKIIKRFESEIDIWQKAMPERKNFILPGGSNSAAELFIARSVVRRLERKLVYLSEKQNIKPNILIFTNRLSDYLFVLARYINFQEKIKETIWKK
jgi:cob(I)alamin adenosyltransferase